MAVMLTTPEGAGLRTGVTSRLLGEGTLQLWRTLTQQILAFRPDIVVLVARKTPRLLDLLPVPFPTRVFRTTDCALPYLSQQLVGRRVAIVDDLVNHGSTVNHAIACVVQAGAAEVHAFALARGTHSPCLVPAEVTYASREPLSEQRMQRISFGVPLALQTLLRPYDLTFPVIPCHVRAPISRYSEFRSRLRARWSEGDIHEHSSLASVAQKRYRVSLDFESGGGDLSKWRLYYDSREQDCNAVPMVIPASLQAVAEAPKSCAFGAEGVWEVARERYSENVQSSSHLRGLAFARLHIYLHSLQMGVRNLGDLREVLAPVDESLVCRTDVDLVFGPDVGAALADHAADLYSRSEPKRPLETSGPAIELSSMLARNSELKKDIVERLAQHTDPSLDLVFRSAFAALAAHIGANDPRDYRLRWPFSYDEVQEDQYLRLRVGFTFADLLEIADLLGLPADEARRQLSALLDDAVDSGVVVPTIAPRDGVFVRVYRNGESPEAENSIGRALRAWDCSEIDVSPTRFTKIWAILSMSDLVRTGAELAQLTRGTVASVPDAGSSGAHAIGTWLRQGGYLAANAGRQD